MRPEWFQPDVVWISLKDGNDCKVEVSEPVDAGCEIVANLDGTVRRKRHDDNADAVIGVAIQGSLSPRGFMRIWNEKLESD